MVQRSGHGRVFRRRGSPFFHLVAGFAFLFVLNVSGHVFAQDASAPDVSAWTQGYINPFPQSDRYKLYVIGDFLAAGLADALPDALDETTSVDIERETRNNSGLARPDYYNWSARVEDILEGQSVHIAVIMLGSNDRRRIRTANGFEEFGTDAWTEAYRLRVDALVEKLTEANVAVYWMGLPIVAEEEARADYEQINSIIRERAYLGGVKYIDTWNGFSDQFGNYSAFGPSVAGVTKRLRDNNGIGFTAEGNRKLAEFAASVIKRDLAAARRERSIPLAGDEQQQEQIAGVSGEVETLAIAEPDESATRRGDREDAPGFTTEMTESESPDETSDNMADAVAGAGRAVSFSDYSPPGEQLAIDIGSGLTALATISPANILSARGARQQLPLSERLYYRVLVRGEKLEAPAGRVDNYKWDGG
ncbi:MAG: DUF459 domain-containing protein [Dichotomicrobium sp.]